ncbi:MAG: RodZ domain-containing protein [Cyanobacteria bacterium J06628_6]
MTSYSTLQQDQLRKIGANLQEARAAQDKSIEDIAAQTYIRPQLLKAIEAGQATDLPQPIFVQGFIRRYAEALGLDGKTLAKQFPVHSIPDTPRPQPQPAAKPVSFGSTAMANPVITSRSDRRPMPTSSPAVPSPPPASAPPATPAPLDTSVSAASLSPSAPTPEPMPAARVTANTSPVGAPPFDDSDLERQTYSSNGVVAPVKHPQDPTYARPPLPVAETPAGERNFMPYVLAGVLAVGVVGAIALLFNLGGGEPQQAEIEPTPAVAEPAEPASVPEPAEPAEPASPTAASEAPVAVSIKTTDDAWMLIRIDGVNAFEGIMTSGTEELYEGEDRIYVSVGNAGGVEISHNGSEPEVAGPSGAVREFTYTP